MADWTIGAGSGLRPYRSPYGSPILREFQASTCASTATIRMGAVVTLNTLVSTGVGGRIVLGPSSGGGGGNLLEVGITSLLGVAMSDDTSAGTSSGASATKVIVAMADPVIEFIGFQTNGVCASSLIGTNKALRFDTTNRIHVIDSTNSTAALAAVKITDIPSYALGDTNGPVVFKFLSSNYAL